MALPPPPARSPRRWRFTWEALAHMPTLRLFLFNPEVDPSRRCGDLRASLCSQESLLLVTWTEEGAGDLALRVPVPRVLVDPASPVQCVARGDHIEAKLGLVLPLDHPMCANLHAALDGGGSGLGLEGGFSDCSLPLPLDSDIKSLSAGDVHFYCRTCCTRLTRRPQRSFVEMPSANWCDVADNWFGACCCSFGGASEKLVHEYIKLYKFSETTCLLDGPSVIICKDDLDGSVFQKCPGEQVDNGSMSDPVAKREAHCGASAGEGIPNGCESLRCLPQKDWGLTDDPTEWSLDERKDAIKAEGKMDASESFDGLASAVNQSFSKELFHSCADETNNILNHACGGSYDVSAMFSGMRSSMKDSASQRNCNWSRNGSLGGGFMIKTSNLSKDVQWVEFLCRQCSSPLGLYPTAQGLNDPVDGGIRLFKCYVSTSMDPGGPHNVFRMHTLQRIFVNLLLESATDELSFRTIVRDLRTKSPMLQIILLNSKAWCVSSDCFENGTFRCPSKVNLKPVVKVLFSDCCPEASVSSSAVEQWVTKNHADEVYMMACQTKELLEFLKSAHDSLPPSYSLFQGMSLSYVER